MIDIYNEHQDMLRRQRMRWPFRGYLGAPGPAEFVNGRIQMRAQAPPPPVEQPAAPTVAELRQRLDHLKRQRFVIELGDSIDTFHRTDRVMRTRTAYHEAGHGVVARLELGTGIVQELLLRASGPYGTCSVRVPARRVRADAWLRYCCAGPVAVAIFAARNRQIMMPNDTRAYRFDVHQAEQELGRPVGAIEHGQAHTAVWNLLERHWDTVTVVAETLLARGQLSGAQFESLVHDRLF